MSRLSSAVRRIALLMTVCEAERRIAPGALASVVAALPGTDLTLFIVDDASPSHVGRGLLDLYPHLPGHLVRFERSLGFTGTARRLFAGLAAIADSKTEFDAIVKFDPDALVVTDDLAGFIGAVAPDGRGLHGVISRMRKRDALLLVADLFPVGFRRRYRDGVIQRKWELSRLRPVWWWGIGWRAVLRGMRFRYIAGGLCILGGRTLRELGQRGWLRLKHEGRHGFTFTDDMLLSVATVALGHAISDPARIRPNWAVLDGDHATDWEGKLAAGALVLHPLKDNPRADEVRKMVAEKRAAATVR
jgi:hypothetical protein